MHQLKLQKQYKLTMIVYEPNMPPLNKNSIIMHSKRITCWGSSSPVSFGKRLHKILLSGPSFDPSISTQTTFSFSKYSNFSTISFVGFESEVSSSCIWRMSLSGCIWYIFAASRFSLGWTFFGRFLLLWPSSSSSTTSSSNLEFSTLEDMPVATRCIIF